MNSTLLKTHLSSKAIELLAVIQTHEEIDSTSSEVMRLLEAGEEGAILVVADSQFAGRGRRGRAWQSHKGSGIYMTLSFPIENQVIELQALSLITALSVQQSLTDLGFEGINLKWPNDLLVSKKKLAGILLELRKGSNQSQTIQHVVFGIGINYSLSLEQKTDIGRPVADLFDLSDDLPEREQIAAQVCAGLLDMIEEFLSVGFAPFQSRWNSLDRYFESDIVIDNGKQRLIGKSLGVNAEGVLQVLTAEGQQSISAGEIFPSLREANEATES